MELDGAGWSCHGHECMGLLRNEEESWESRDDTLECEGSIYMQVARVAI